MGYGFEDGEGLVSYKLVVSRINNKTYTKEV